MWHPCLAVGSGQLEKGLPDQCAVHLHVVLTRSMLAVWVTAGILRFPYARAAVSGSS